MTRIVRFLLLLLWLLLCWHATTAWNAVASNNRRRALVGTVTTAVIATIGVPAVAVDDLAMPTASEQAQLDEDAMKERLRRKAELQAKAATPKTFGDSFKNERAKQQELKSQTKEERRAALCEELGRGC